jgi:hypothetical protein
VCSGTSSTYTTGRPAIHIDNGGGSSAGLTTFQAGDFVAPLATPTFTPGSQAFVGTISVTITLPGGTAGCYTTDGSTPTATIPGTCSHGSTYSSGLSLSSTTTMKAIATKVGQVNSSVATATYTLHTPTNWYVDPLNGGPRYSAASSPHVSNSCNGSSPTAFNPSGGKNQNCPYNTVEQLWNDPYVAADANYVMLSGDVAIIANCSQSQTTGCEIAGASSAAAQGNPCWGTGVYCVPPTLPSGVTIQGLNAGSCRTNLTVPNNPSYTYTAGDPTKQAWLWAGGGAFFALSFISTQNGAISCVHLSDHSPCGAVANPVTNGHPSPTCGADYASYGIYRGTATTPTNGNNTFTDVTIEGFQSKGMIGNIGGTWYYNYVAVGGNGQTGDDYDPGSGQISTGSFVGFHYYSYFNGCSQEYPYVHTIPFTNCLGQSNGGQGDGIGTPVTQFPFSCNQCGAWYNTQDAFDLGHTYGSTYSVTNSMFFGNLGGNTKFGPNSSGTIASNLIDANCTRMFSAITGMDPFFNINLSDGCRASTAGGTNILSNSPILSGTFTSTGVNVVGTNTHFTTELANGNTIVPDETPISNGRTVTVIDDTHLTLSSAFAADISGDYVSRLNSSPASTSAIHRYFNTIWTYANAFWDDQCQGIANLGTGNPGQAKQDPSLCPSGYTIDDRDNIYNGYSNPGYNLGVQPIVWTELVPTTENHELCFTVRSAQCVGAGDLTGSPLFVSQPATPMTAESQLDNPNFVLSGSSPAIGAGVTISIFPSDYSGNPRHNPPSMGALDLFRVVKIIGDALGNAKIGR